MTDWNCPACGGKAAEPLWQVQSDATENGVNAQAFRPSTDRYGETIGSVLRCRSCSHGSLASTPSAEALAAAYADAADPVSIDEEPGQVETARRSVATIGQFAQLGRLLDVGCWTGSFVAAADQAGWQASGVDPSTWAVERAQSRGLDVALGGLETLPAADDLRCVVMCDVIEHVLDVDWSLRRCADQLAPGGVLYLTTPDAGSRIAKLLGHRWWSVLPMHVQYFTRASMRAAVERAGLQVVRIDTHPKVFTAAYYADRLEGYSPALAKAVKGAVAAAGVDQRPVAPDFRDRMQVVAVKRS